MLKVFKKYLKQSESIKGVANSADPDPDQGLDCFHWSGSALFTLERALHIFRVNMVD